MADYNDEKGKKDKDTILATARQRAQVADQGWSINFDLMDDDIDFLHGNHWPGQIEKAREGEGRPVLTFNKMPSMMDQIVGDQRQNRPQINVVPVQGNNTKVPNVAGTKDYSLAEIYSGLIRNIEYVSRADVAYDTAFEHASGWGLGWFRITTQYADDDTFDQDLRIKRVRNWRAVLADPTFEEPDGSDQDYNFYFTKMHKDEFKRRFPGKECVDAQLNSEAEYQYWIEGEYVRLAEYYERLPVKKTLHLMNDGSVYDEEKLTPIIDELAQMGITSTRTRTVDSHKVVWRKISGADILEEQDTVFAHIPMIPVLGKELVVKGEIYYRGAIRHAKDAQRMYNYSRTAQIERVALEPKAPFIVTKKQIKGFEDRWDTANTKNHPYLVINDTNEGFPQRQFPAQVSQGDTQLSLQAADDIKGTMGMFDASLGAQSNETSGKAIMARQREGDVGNFAFTDNLSRSLEHAGRICIQAIPKIYDTQRQLRIRFQDETEDFVEINKTIMDEQTQTPVLINDLSVGKYDVRVKTGPSYTTQRMEAADAITQFIQALGASDPVTAKALTMLAAQNMDWPGSDEVVKILKKSLPPGYIEPEEGEEPPPEQPPTPEDIAMMEKAKGEQAKAEATMAKAEADKAKAQADMMTAIEKINNLEESIQNAVANAMTQALMQVSAM